MRRLMLVVALLGACGADEVVVVDAEAPACSECNPFVQAGCSATERCTFQHDAEGGSVGQSCNTLCVPEGTLPLGAACEITPGEVDDCIGATLCRAGTCAALCGNPTPGCAAGFCPLADPFDEAILLAICTPPCDPLAPACGPGEACYLPRWDGEGPGCAPEGLIVEGGSCHFPEECVAGASCVDQVCRTICDPTMALCPSPQTCDAWPAGASSGVCR